MVLLLVTGDEWVPALAHWRDYVPPLEGEVWLGVMLGAFLAFYAYIGFEDMVNMAEKSLPPKPPTHKALR